MRTLAVMLALGITAPGAGLEDRVLAAIAASPEARQAFWGIKVVDLAGNNVLYTQNENFFFVPASNTKLFSTALALTRLGPNYRFRTTVEADAEPDSKGVIRELRLVGGGDPNLSARVIPYKEDTAGLNPLAAVEALADQIVARGVRMVAGDIVGDDTAYVWEPYPDGWSVDDPVWEYGAPVSALTINDNAFTLTAAPGAPGGPAILTLQPSLEWFTIHNRTATITSGEARLRLDRLPGARELVVSGTVRGRRSSLVAIDDPALFAAHALRDALAERGVTVRGNIRARHRNAEDTGPRTAGIGLAKLESAPLSQIVQVVNKVSQNLHAEILLREVARAATGIGSRKAGLKELEAFLTEIGVPEKQYRFEDGSGLSRLTLVTPATISRLLLFMHNGANRDVWIESLPIGGEDGTLSTRFERRPAGKSIRAKTGSISHVSSLSGYALGKDGRTYAFAIMANNYNSEAAPVRKVIDQIALVLLD